MTEHEQKMVFELEKLCAEIKGGKYHSRGYFLAFVEPATEEHPDGIIIERDDGLSYLELLGLLASCSGGRSAELIEHDSRYADAVPPPTE